MGGLRPNLNLNPNLEVEPANPPKKSKRIISEVLLDIFSIFAAVGLGWALKNYIVGLTDSFWLILFGVVFLVFQGLEVILQKNFGRRLWVVVLQTILVLVWMLPLYAHALGFMFVLFVVLCAFILWGEKVSRMNVENLVKFKFGTTFRPVANKTITGMVLIGVLLYLPQWDAEGGVLSRRNFFSFYDSSIKVAESFWSDFTFNGTVGDFLNGPLRQKFSKQQAFNELFPAAQDKLLSDQRAIIISAWNESAPVKIDDSMSAREALYQIVLQKLDYWRSIFGDRFLAIWGIAAFFVIRGVAFAMFVLSFAITFFIYEVLIALNLVEVYGESVTKEIVDFSGK